MARTKVLIVDDSALMRQLMKEILADYPEFEVVGTAQDPYDAWRKVKDLDPDVMTLDVEMPRMDGVSFLERLMHLHPMPVLMVSSLTEAGCATTLRALDLGAVDFVAKPRLDIEEGVPRIADELIHKLRATAMAKPLRQTPRQATTQTQRSCGSAMLKTTVRIVGIGASTGGTEALREVLTALPPDAPPIAVVQHMPPGFTRAFAERMNTLCAVRVKEASDGDRMIPGHVLIAPGNYHLALTRSGANYAVRVFNGESVNRHRPSVDVLFHSIADLAGANAVGVLLTGMGNDGAAGLKSMRDRAAHTIAQNEETSVVFGMPKEAIALGAATEILPLPRICDGILDACQR
jgi:two-component system chemotaxis response regulator CheB